MEAAIIIIWSSKHSHHLTSSRLLNAGGLAGRGLDLVVRDGLVGAPGVDVYFPASFMILHVGVHGALFVRASARPRLWFSIVYL